MTRALVFDIDNTLTPPREALDRAMADRLSRLAVPFALAAGSDLELLMSQFFEPLYAHGYRGEFDAFICNGASRYRCRAGAELTVEPVDEFSLRAHLGDAGFQTLHSLLAELLDDPAFALPSSVPIAGERMIDRGAMINLAPSGREKGALSPLARESRDRFVAFDAQSGYRERLMPVLRARIDERLPGNDLRISFGGQTSFDIVVRGRDKSFAVRTLLDEGAKSVTYVGDAVFPGGNDAAVLDLVESWTSGPCPVEVIQVRDFVHTAALMERWMRPSSER